MPTQHAGPPSAGTTLHSLSASGGQNPNLETRLDTPATAYVRFSSVLCVRLNSICSSEYVEQTGHVCCQTA